MKRYVTYKKPYLICSSYFIYREIYRKRSQPGDCLTNVVVYFIACRVFWESCSAGVLRRLSFH